MACGAPFRVAQSLAFRMETQDLLLIPNTLFQIPAPTHELNSGLIVRWFGQIKLVSSKFPDGVSRSQGTKSPKCAPASGKTLSRRVTARSGLTSALGTTINPARWEAAFHCKPSFRLGAANS